MSFDRSTHTTDVSAALIAEAAVWLAMLHGPERTAAVEQEFSKWLRTSPAHAQAFEEVDEIWAESRNLPRGAPLNSTAGGTRIVAPVLGLVAGIAMAAVGILSYLEFAGVATDLGEQRSLLLEDGTRVLLNTQTRVVVSYDKQRRLVELKTGEAHFEVAKRPDWPFIVNAGAQQVTALGTEFTVRRDTNRITVTLVEGEVAVAPSVAGAEAADVASSHSSAKQSITLAPGQQATFVAGRLAVLGQADLQIAMAWQRHEVAFDDTPLPDAVAEMNRYSVRPVVIASSNTEQVRIAGLFRAGDSLSFARAVAATYRLEVIEEEDRILLTGAPKAEGF